MRGITVVILAGLLPVVAGGPLRAADKADQTAEMNKAAQAFVKAYHKKDLAALLAVAYAPFMVGTMREPRKLKDAAELRAELRARLGNDAAVRKFPTAARTAVTWERALGDGPTAERDRRLLKPLIDLTGEGGGYAPLGNYLRGGRRLFEASDVRLLVGMRGGQAKVLGIILDSPPPPAATGRR